MPLPPNGLARAFLHKAGESAGNLTVRKLIHPDLCSYADIPVMQTSENGNRDEFAWAQLNEVCAAADIVFKGFDMEPSLPPWPAVDT